MGRRKQSQPSLEPEFIQRSFRVRQDGQIIRASTGDLATFTGPSGALLIRCYHQGQVRRFTATRVAWALSTGEWPNGVVHVRDGDERNLRASNLVLTKRGPRPFVQSAGGKGSSLERRTQADAALLSALAEHQGALTVPQLSISVGRSAPCCCVRLAKLERNGLVCGPHCNARKHWNLTEAGKAVASSSAPLIPDDTDKRILGALALASMRLVRLAAEVGCCNFTIRRRINTLIERGAVEIDESRRFQISAKGRDFLGDDIPPRWLDPRRISAAAAKDVAERHGRERIDDRTNAMKSQHASRARQKASATGRFNRAPAFNHFDLTGQSPLNPAPISAMLS